MTLILVSFSKNEIRALFYDFSLEEVDHEENSKTASKKRRSVLLAKISANKSRNRTVNESDASGEFWSISGNPTRSGHRTGPRFSKSFVPGQNRSDSKLKVWIRPCSMVNNGVL